MICVKLEDAEPGTETSDPIQHIDILKREVLRYGKDRSQHKEETEKVLKEALTKAWPFCEILPCQENSQYYSKHKR